MMHELKSWPTNFEPLRMGLKTCEVRQDDRGYHIGDKLLIHEWEPGRKEHTGRSLTRVVTHLLRGGQFGIEAGYVLLSLKKEGWGAR